MKEVTADRPSAELKQFHELAVRPPVLATSPASGSTTPLNDRDFEAVVAGMARLPVDWFQPIDARRSHSVAGRTDRWLLLEQLEGPALGNFTLSHVMDGFCLRIEPIGEESPAGSELIGTFATVEAAMIALGKFLSEVLCGYAETA